MKLATRALALTAALLACAWFALGARQAHELARAQAIVGQGTRLSAAQAANARSLLDSAAWLNPDHQVDLLRAELASEQQDQARAQAIAQGVVRAEPDNPLAWFALIHDAKTASVYWHAVHRLAQLMPRLN